MEHELQTNEEFSSVAFLRPRCWRAARANTTKVNHFERFVGADVGVLQKSLTFLIPVSVTLY